MMGSVVKKEPFTVVRQLDVIAYLCVMLNCIQMLVVRKLRPENGRIME